MKLVRWWAPLIPRFMRSWGPMRPYFWQPEEVVEARRRGRELAQALSEDTDSEDLTDPT